MVSNNNIILERIHNYSIIDIDENARLGAVFIKSAHYNYIITIYKSLAEILNYHSNP